MTEQLPATREEADLVIDMAHDLHADHRDPQAQQVQQNLSVAIIPLALVAFVVLAVVAAAWTLMGGGPPPTP